MNSLLKKVDLLILKSFVGPFFMTFFVVLFVFIMQFFFVYIDDFVGKGLAWYVIAELVLYLSANTVPLALPLAILLSSIMTFGNLGERYELIAMKAGGISLGRFTRGLMVTILLVSIGSLAFSNYVLPSANLKFYTTLFEITHKKPALNIKEDVYYKDIDDFVIKINRKGEDNRSIYGVYIRDNRNTHRETSIITADHGEMFTTADERFLVLKLYDGAKYQILPPERGVKKVQPTLETYFSEMEKVFDLSALDLQQTDEEHYKDHYVMLNISQLNVYMDSMQRVRKAQLVKLSETLHQKYYFLYDSLAFHRKVADSLYAQLDSPSVIGNVPIQKRNLVFNRAMGIARGIKNHLESPIVPRWKNAERFTIKANVERHRKITLAISCFMLLLIGAPFGAIVRKGGIGLPLVASTVLYVLFMILTKLCENFAKNQVLPTGFSMWLPILIMLPIGIFMMHKAMNDSSLLILESYQRFFKKLFKKQKTDGS